MWRLREQLRLSQRALWALRTGGPGEPPPTDDLHVLFLKGKENTSGAQQSQSKKPIIDTDYITSLCRRYKKKQAEVFVVFAVPGTGSKTCSPAWTFDKLLVSRRPCMWAPY